MFDYRDTFLKNTLIMLNIYILNINKFTFGSCSSFEVKMVNNDDCEGELHAVFFCTKDFCKQSFKKEKGVAAKLYFQSFLSASASKNV